MCFFVDFEIFIFLNFYVFDIFAIVFLSFYDIF